MRSYPAKENPIRSAVSEILRYKQTDRQTHILLLYYKDYWFDFMVSKNRAVVIADILSTFHYNNNIDHKIMIQGIKTGI